MSNIKILSKLTFKTLVILVISFFLVTFTSSSYASKHIASNYTIAELTPYSNIELLKSNNRVLLKGKLNTDNNSNDNKKVHIKYWNKEKKKFVYLKYGKKCNKKALMNLDSNNKFQLRFCKAYKNPFTIKIYLTENGNKELLNKFKIDKKYL